MKQTLKDYFERKYLRWKQNKNSLPLIAWDEDVSRFMYIGDINHEGYTQWKAVEKNEFYDFEAIEGEFNVKLHFDIKEYFNSYWFLEMVGGFGDYSIILEPVAPGIGLRDFHANLKEYYQSHNKKLNYIPIGFESDGLLVVLDNETGEVYIEDHERGIYKKIAGSLKELINKL